MNVYKAASQRHLLSSEQLKALVKKKGCHQIKNCCPLELANSNKCFFAFPLGLLTQTELLNDSTITLDVLALEVVEERTALTYHLNE